MGYASDYPMVEILDFETICGIDVPKSELGHYLNWNEINPERTKARMLTSPYGSLQFAVGFDKDGQDLLICFDYALLPDDRVVLDCVINSDSGGYIESVDYLVVEREHAISEALCMVGEALDALAVNQGEHDEKGWNQDPYYLVRSLAHTLGIEPYAKQSTDQLRRGNYPVDLVT